jgi:hypothetical protein
LYARVYEGGRDDIGHPGSLFGLRPLGFGLRRLGDVGLDVVEEVLYLESSAEYTFPEHEVVLALEGGDDDLVVPYRDGFS